MKRVFPVSSKTFALALAVSVAIAGGTGSAYADLMGKMNPVSWFSNSQSEEKSAQEAQKRAEAAQEQANQALKAAQEALSRAEQIKKQADALQNQANEQQAKVKPTVKAPEPETTDAESLPTESAETSQIQAESKKWSWNPLKLSKPSATAAQQPVEVQPEEATAATNASTQLPQAFESAATTAETTGESSAPSKSGTPWNPLTWFSKPATETETAITQQATAVEPAKSTVSTGELSMKTKAAVMETEKGNIVFELYPDQAPATVANFTKLVSDGFYNRFNMKFHRVVPGFVIQTGDPTGTGAGGSKERIPLEAKNKLSHNAKGMVAMARGADPNSASSQFYITLTPQTTLDGKYAIFGKVIAGMDILDKIEKDNMLYGIRLVDLDTVVRDAQPEKKKFFSSIF